MSARRGPWMNRCLDLLADGQWHQRDWIIAETAKIVPPGIAKRKAEWIRTRRALAAGRVPDPRVKQRSDEFLIRVGGRRLVYDSVVASTLLERKVDENGTHWVRLKGSGDGPAPAAT